MDRFLRSKGIEKDDIAVLGKDIPTYDQFIDELHQKIADDRMKSETVHNRKLLLEFVKTTIAFKTIINEKYDGDEDLVDDIKHLSLSEVRICITYKSQSGDDALPSTKKSLLEHWQEVKDCLLLTKGEYLKLFGDIDKEVIAIVCKELY